MGVSFARRAARRTTRRTKKKRHLLIFFSPTTINDSTRMECVELFTYSRLLQIPDISNARKMRKTSSKTTAKKKGQTSKKGQHDDNEVPTVRQLLVGGTLLGSRQRKIPSDFAAWDRFAPIITPEVRFTEGGDQSQRFVLLPHSHHIAVLAYQTGTQIATLVPFQDDFEARDPNHGVFIESVCLVNHSKKTTEKTIDSILRLEEDSEEEDVTRTAMTLEQIEEEVLILAGCRDGSIREFSLQQLGSTVESLFPRCGSYHVVGPCHRPRRIVAVTKGDPIMHLTAPRLGGIIHPDGILTYAIIRTKDIENPVDLDHTTTEQNMNIKVLRVLLPFFDKNRAISLLQKQEGDIQRKWQVDNFRCRVGRDKAGGFMNTTPFQLLSIAKAGVKDCSVFIVVAQANTVQIYFDRALKRDRHPPMQYPMPVENPITSIHISPNNEDIACGHYFGEISVMNGVLPDLEKYQNACSKAEQRYGSNAKAHKPKDPRTKLIISKAHWHAHAVGSLVYDPMSSPMDPVLYTGGTESVLVTWQMAQGRSKPLHFLPRVALGAIIHVVCADKVDDLPSSGVLVYSEDNSLQLIESHSKGRLWKIQGLACNMKNSNEQLVQNTNIEVDPLAKGSEGSRLVITGLPEAPGFIHWYDTSRRCLTASLEVAAFNKVSKTEAEDLAMPVPSITAHTFCRDGKELITVDETPTENVFVGAFDHKGFNKGGYGVVTTVRFWECNTASLSDSVARDPYVLIAAMTFPHGPKNVVSSLAASKDGKSACTVSNGEKAFRIWKKMINEEDDTRRRPTWTCAYKVTLPAGFSNYSTRRQAVSFSEDGSTLGIGCGNMVTIWDSEEARFLTSVRHFEGAVGTIDSIEFISIESSLEVLLIKSDHAVSVQSPFGSIGAFKGWIWGVPWGTKCAMISSVAFVRSERCVAITVYDSKKEASRLFLVDATTGAPRKIGNSGTGLLDGIDGRVISLTASERSSNSSLWGDDTGDNDSGLRLYSLAANGNLSLFTETIDTYLVENVTRSAATGPTVLVSNKKNRKRGLDRPTIRKTEPLSKKSALQLFGMVSGADSKAVVPTTSELPSLSQNFVRAFVERSLLKRNKSDPKD